MLTAVFAASSYALPSLRVGSQFQSAQGGSRTWMDVGGVWGGDASGEVSATTGDTFTFSLTNEGDETAFNLTTSVTLPSGFHYVTGTAQVQGTWTPLPVITNAVQAGNVLTFTLNPANVNLPAGETLQIRFGLRTDNSVVSGSSQLIYNYAYDLSDEEGAQRTAGQEGQSVLVIGGDSVIQVSAEYGERAVGEIETFTVVVRNTSRGGLFDVRIDESLINPGNHLQLMGPMTQLSPVGRAATPSGGGAVMTLPYLAPGEEFIVQVNAQVLSCGNIVNIVTTTDRTGATQATSESPVRLDLKQPLITFSTPQIELAYATAKRVSIEFTNTRMGSAHDFVLETTLHERAVVISNVSAGWTYNAASGSFTLVGNDGTIADGHSRTLQFDIQATDVCIDSGGGIVYYMANYTNACGDRYLIPQQIGSVEVAPDTPSLLLAKSVSDNRIAVNQTGSYGITLGATHIENISTETVVVTDRLPDQIEVLGTDAPAGTTVSVVGGVLSWSVPRSMLGTARTLTVDFKVNNDPCLAGDLVANEANATVRTIAGCEISAEAQVQFFVSNNPELTASQFFNVGTPVSGGFFQTGNASEDLTRDRGEGDFIPFEAEYVFGEGYPGTWDGSTYTDNFGGVAGQQLVQGSMTYTLIVNGVTVRSQAAVPTGEITSLATGFSLNLSFLKGDLGAGASVQNTQLRLNYRTTIPDEALGGAVTRSITQRTDLIIAEGGGGAGICDVNAQNRFTQGAFYTVGRAAATIALSGMPSELELCKEETLLIRVNNLNSGITVYNPQVTLEISGTPYELVSGQTPVYGGAFAGKMSHDFSGANPVFTYAGEGESIGGEGTIALKVIRSTGSTARTGFSARVNYDSREMKDSAEPRAYSAVAAYTPLIVHEATLALTVTPGTLSVMGRTVEYTVFLTNTNAGTAFNSILRNRLPVGLAINEPLTNAANPSQFPVNVSGQELDWELGDVAPGQMIAIKVVVDILDAMDGSGACAIVIDGERITASWGCEGNTVALPGVMPPAFFFPRGKMQVIHDSTQSVARLCDTGRIAIIVRNTGPTDIFDIDIEEVIPANSGIEIHGNVQYRVNGGALQTALAAPDRTGDAYNWSKAQIPDLARLSPQDEIRIEFAITAGNELAALTESPVLNASARARVSCGEQVVSPAQSFSIPMERPRLTISKVGRNITANPSAPFAETVYGGRGDVVQWSVTIRNSGQLPARHMRLRDMLSDSNATLVTVSGPGFAGDVAYTPGSWIALMDGATERELLPNSEITYIFTEQLGSNCVNNAREAQISWSCGPVPAGEPGVFNSPGTPADSAALIMNPVITNGGEISQTVTYLANGRVQMNVAVRNSGGNAHQLEVQGTLSAGMVYDNSVEPEILPSSSASITDISVDASTLSAPVFTLGESTPNTPLRYGEEIHLRYYLRPANMDTRFAETFPDLASAEGSSLDPSHPANATSTVRVDYQNSCGAVQNDSNSLTFALRIPDLDITAAGPNSGNNLLGETITQNYTFRVANVGQANSIAENITLDLPDLGAGWQVGTIRLTTTGAGGNTSNATIDADTGHYTLGKEQVGSLAAGSHVDIQVQLTYNAESSSGSLRLLLRARGAMLGQDGATNYGNYSYDQRAQRVLGVSLSKTPAAAPYSSIDESSGTNVLISEEFKWLITAKFNGGEASVENLVIRDKLGHGDAEGAIGYVSHTFTAAHQLGSVTTSSPEGILAAPPVKSGLIQFDVPQITAADMVEGRVFEAELTGRVMNVAANLAGAQGISRENHLGMSFTYLGMTFKTSEAALGFGGAGEDHSLLYASHALQVHRPQLQITRMARNVTKEGVFSAEPIAGQAGDIIEYRVVVSNPSNGIAPLYSIVVGDEVAPARLGLIATSAGADTDDNGVVDIANASGVNAGAGTIVFNDTNTVIGTAGQSLARLDPGESLVLLYSAELLQGVNPSETITSTVTASGQSIPAPSGGHSAHEGSPDAEDGALVLSAEATTPSIVIDSIVHDKAVVNYSVSQPSESLVRIGEQIRYRISIVVPQGTVPNFVVTDKLPSGLALLDTPAVAIGSGISAAGTQPAISQRAVAGGALEVEWDFGERIAQIGSDEAQRTVTIEYLTQVRNAASNVKGVELTNEAYYTFTGLPGDVVNLRQHTVTIVEPVVTLTKAAAADGPIQAGSVLTYTVTLDNTEGNAAAHDLNLVDTLPLGVTYIANSTNGLPEPEVSGNADDGWVLTWGRTHTEAQDLDIAATQTLQFSYQVRVDNTSIPEQVYANSIRADWTSLDGSPGPHLGVVVGTAGEDLGERIGSEAHNNYMAAEVSNLTADNMTFVTKTAAGQTLPINADGTLAESPTAYRIGDIVTYTLTLQVQEATLRQFKVLDSLPAGLKFVQTESISLAADHSFTTYTSPLDVAGKAPLAEATGDLTWDFGLIVNEGDGNSTNDEITLVYTARVVDDTAAYPVSGSASTERKNVARISFQKADNSIHQTEPSEVTVLISQPVIAIEKTVINPTPENILRPGESGKFRVAIQNTGAAPAYNLVWEDEIPVQMRATEPQLTRADLNGNSILADLQAASLPAWNETSGKLAFELTDGQFILPSQELVLEYTFTIDEDAVKGQTLTNTATVLAYYGKPSADTVERRSYEAVSSSAEVIVGLEIRGFIYNDIEPNGQRDAFENWETGTSVYVNLVNSANRVYRSVEVPSGEGGYVLTRLPPGDYDIIVTASAVSVGASAPSASAPGSWLFRIPQSGKRSVALLDAADRLEQNFGLYQGLVISGQVIRDNGASGGIANNAQRDGNEIGLPNVKLRLLGGTTLLDETVTDGNGNFSLYVPDGVENNAQLVVAQVNLPLHRSTGGNAGTSGGAYDRDSDRVTFTFNGNSVTGLLFADVPESEFSADGVQRIESGAAAYYRHVFVAGTAGTVVFDTESNATPSIPWAQAIILSNSSGEVEGQPTINGQPITVSAGEEIHIVVREQSPLGAPYGAQNRLQVRATLTYTNASPALSETLVCIDLTSIGSAGAAGLQLTKTVDKERAKPGEELTYIITYTNNGSEPISDLFIDDRTPHYTTFVSAEHQTPLPDSLESVTLVAPDPDAVGAIRWTFTGTLAPGASGQVSFKVRVLP